MDNNLIQKITNDIKTFKEAHTDGIVILRGTTASGKTATSIALAKGLPLEIINSDSRQIFKYMDIGTDKIPLQIRQAIPHRQMDIITPDIHYTAGQRKNDTENIINNVLSRNKTPIIVGGTGLYIDMIYRNYSMPNVPPNYPYRDELLAQENRQAGFLYTQLQKIDPKSAQKIHPNNSRYIIRALEIYHETGKNKSFLCTEQTVKQPILMIGLRRDKQNNSKRIIDRTNKQIQNGLVEEVQWLLDQGYTADLQAMQGICYKQTIDYLYNKTNKDERIAQIIQANQHYAKKQRSRLRKYIQEGKQQYKKNVSYKVYEVH